MSEPAGSYTGVQNLEVMADAHNYNEFLVDLLLDGLAPDPEEVMLDFGAGAGTFSKLVGLRGHRVDCLEPDPLLLTRLRSAGFTGYSTLGESKKSYRLVYSLNVLEHIEDDVGAMRELKTHLDFGAKVFFYVPAFGFLFTEMDRLVGHHRRYTRRSLSAVFEAAGYEVDRTRYADSIGFFATYVLKLFGPSDGTLNPRMIKLYDTFIFPFSRLLDPVLGRWLGKNVYVSCRVVS